MAEIAEEFENIINKAVDEMKAVASSILGASTVGQTVLPLTDVAPTKTRKLRRTKAQKVAEKPTPLDFFRRTRAKDFYITPGLVERLEDAANYVKAELQKK